MTEPLKLVIFDVDGTLIDSQDHILAAMNHAFAAVGHDAPARREVLSIVGLSLPEAIARLAPQFDPALQDAIVTAYKQSFNTQRLASHPPLFPGARQALDDLAGRDDVLLGVATGKSRRGLDHILAVYGLEGYFFTRQVADDHPSKPNPSMILAALAETGIAPARAIMVGDTTFDIDMGRAAAVRTLGVTWGYHPEAALRAAGPDALIGDYTQIGPTLEHLWRLA